ncbi:WD domain-containing protein [Cladophialophora immunda]|nr:WD domain-containing protein [Cladophialophora immunda]
MSSGGPSPASVIESAFSRFQASVSADDARTFHSTTLEDVWKAAVEIEREQRQRSALRNMKRIEPLLKTLGVYASALDTLCNGTPFLPWVWAPIKLMLQLATRHLSSFDSLMGAYVKIADSLPRFDRYSVAIPQGDFQNVLALVYANIIEFHRRAYKFFRRKVAAWILLFETGWKSFELRFESILKDLAYHRDLVDREACSFDLVEAERSRQKIDEEISKAEDDRESSHLQAVLSWLCVDELSQNDILWRLKEKRSDGTCDWIFKNSQYQHWVKNDSKTPWLWLTGIPGSGESVFAAHIIETLREDKGQATLFYFCLQQAAGEDKASVFLRTLAIQLVRDLPGLAAFIWDAHVRNAHVPSIDILEKLLPILISGASAARIVLDGLMSIDMGIFVAARIEQAMRAWDLEISDDTQKLGQAQLLQKSKGMFLWVELVIDSLQYSYTDDDFLQRIDELPETLQAAYDRIVEKILSIEDRRTRQKLTSLLELMTYTQRPLSIDELLSVLALDPSKAGDQLPAPLAPKILDFCKPLIDLSSSAAVNFVHFSAREYFRDSTSKFHIREISAHLAVSDACLTYLNTTSVFLTEDFRTKRLHQIVQGQRAIHRYSTDHWAQHLSQCLDAGDETQRLELAAIASKLGAMNWMFKPSEQGVSADVASILQKISLFKEEALDLERNSEDLGEFRTSLINRDPTYLCQIVERYEADIESLLSLTDEELPAEIEKSDLIAFRDKFSTGAFRCRYYGCSDKTNLTFQSTAERDKHEPTHVPLFNCPKSYCVWKDIGFRNRQELEAHMRYYHPDTLDVPIPAIPAQIPDVGHDLWKLSLDDLPDHLKEIGTGWHAVFNPKVRRSLNISLIADFKPDSLVGCAAISSNCLLLATGCNRMGTIFDVPTGQIMSRLDHGLSDKPPRDHYVRAICFSPNGKVVVTSCEDKVIRFWDPTTGAMKFDLKGHENTINGLDFAANGDFLASCSDDLTVRLWDARTGVQRALFHSEAGFVAVAISPDCKFVVAGSWDGYLRAWDVSGRRLVFTAEGHTLALVDVRFSPQGANLLTSSLDKTVRIWSFAEQDPGSSICCVKTMTGHAFFVQSAAYTHDENWILSGGGDNNVYFWDPTTGVPHLALMANESNVFRVIPFPKNDLPPGEGMFVTVSADNTARIWHYFPYKKR